MQNIEVRLAYQVKSEDTKFENLGDSFMWENKYKIKTIPF